ncbi:hypothetical protein CBW21_15350 [Chromobacterium violaceum]|uniref:Uncharacterized protein n=2 Tax=Chromobacterium violaceum TaxID=536 RepID=A0A202B695_CHRVL|nr:hypothetical protein [Chromobacterium violaceum]OVE47044.1 hypothetical protein CBW21_15350 [Chromobacterium violaceum]
MQMQHKRYSLSLESPAQQNNVIKTAKVMKMKKLVLTACLLGASFAALADAQSDCRAAAGSYLTGTVVSGPTFASGQMLNGVELSHTHVRLRADQDGRTYDVAMDNVYAYGYDYAGEDVPSPLNTIQRGDRLQLCGQLYTSGVGIHWVHPNCGTQPTSRQPNGWVKKIYSDGTVSDNYEANTEYCQLWQ